MPGRKLSTPAVTVIAPTRDSQLYHVLADWFAEMNTPQPKALLCNSTTAVPVLVAEGLGVSFVPLWPLTEMLIANRRLKILNVAGRSRALDSRVVRHAASDQLADEVARLAVASTTFERSK